MMSLNDSEIVETKFKPYKPEKDKNKLYNKIQKEWDESLNLNNNNNNSNTGKNTGFKYPPHLSDQEVKEGLDNGLLFKGTLKVNQRNTDQCFVGNPDGEGHNELLILGPKDRNRALHGDEVAVKLKPKENWFLHEAWRAKYKLNPRFPHAKYHRVSDVEDCLSTVPEKHLIKSAQVVAIIDKLASRRVVGHIKPMHNSTAHFVFIPCESRVPRILIPIKRAPTGFYDRPQDFEKFMYLAQLQEWDDDCINPRGILLDNLGKEGDVEAEHNALLRINYVDERDYNAFSDVMKELKKYLEKIGVIFLENDEIVFKIDPKEFDYRRDFRNEVVVTIDPLTARDLDDALHIKRIKGKDGKNDYWEVGVHIADVSYFLPIDIKVNEWARNRGTTVYLVHKAIPMLPSVLCENLCSLNPGFERLTFSIIWTMDDDAKILSTWIGRSVIKSCAKLSYETAQEIIENPKKQFAIKELPTIHCGIKIRQIKETVQNLHFIAQKLKTKRFDRGGLKFDLPKLRFDLEKSKDEKSNLSDVWIPRGIRLDQRKDSNFLVEELMLLANMEVAQRLYKHFNDRAMLRRHPSPKKKDLKTMVEKCAKLGIKIDSTSSKTLGESIEEFTKFEQYAYTIAPALNQLLIKCMHLAQYFCTGAVEGPSDFYHYGLGVDFYTHFTSPIRRYPDIIVHRLLAVSLKYIPDPGYEVRELQGIATRANATKACAKMCSETSADIFFGSLIREYGGMDVVGVVMGLFDEAFDFLLIKYGIVKRVYLKKQKFLNRIYHGKLTKNGPVSLVLWLNQEGKNNNQKEEQQQNIKEVTIVEGLDEGLDENELIEDDTDENNNGNGKKKKKNINKNNENDDLYEDLPQWVKDLKLEEKQTINNMSVVKVRLVTIKDTVKYEANLIPTPDSNPLNWFDAKLHMDE